MSAFAIEDRLPLRRWSVSVTLALLLHGAVAFALVKTILLVNSTGFPVINVDLAPLEAAPDSSPEPGQGAPKLTAPSAGVAASAPSERVMTNASSQGPIAGAGETAQEKIPAGGEGSFLPPTPASRDMSVPGTPGPPNNAVEGNSAETRGISGGGAVPSSRGAVSNERGGAAVETSHPAPSLMDTPLDTSITVMPNLYSKKAGSGMVGKKKNNITLLRPSKHAGTLAHPQHANTANAPAVVINALGAHVQDRVRAAHARAMNQGTEAKNAIGSPIGAGIVGAGHGVNATEGMVRNAVGVPVRVQPSLPGTTIGESKAGPIASAAATSHSAINGRDLVHAPLRTGALGGPAKNAVGVLDGTSFHPRHP